MILYNFRHRGPYEYDKFILNIFQFHNEVVMLHGQIFQQGMDDKNNLLDIKESLDQFYSLHAGDNSLSNKIYLANLYVD